MEERRIQMIEKRADLASGRTGTVDRVWWGTLCGVVIGCMIAAWSNRDNLNTDAIAYAQIARHWVEGRWDLAVSGYWGPLLSWLMAPLMYGGMPPLLAAREVMALSAVLFWLGASGVLRGAGLRRRSVLCSEGILAVCSIAWAGQNISPDLLLSALSLFAVARLWSAAWLNQWRCQAACGLGWGGAYLAKAIGLPMAVVTITAAAVARWVLVRRGFCVFGADAKASSARTVFSAWLRTLGVMGLVSLPWILALSFHYGYPTFSTSGRIAHAVVGPADVDRYHPFARVFHTPAAGRITSWEDPSGMDYRYWSPMESAVYRSHQIGLIKQNAETAVGLLGSFDSVGVGALALFGAVVSLGFRMRRSGGNRPILLWELAWIPVVCLTVLYLPVYLSWFDQRYFFFALPFMLAACFGGLERFGEQTGTGLAATPIPSWVGVAQGVLFLVFLAPNLRPMALVLDGAPDPASSYARDMATRLKGLGIPGSVAGSAIVAGGRTGIYIAYLMDRPWLGDRIKPTADEIANSGAALMVLTRRDALQAELNRDPRFEDLDGNLFKSPRDAENYALKVYKVRP